MGTKNLLLHVATGWPGNSSLTSAASLSTALAPSSFCSHNYPSGGHVEPRDSSHSEKAFELATSLVISTSTCSGEKLNLAIKDAKAAFKIQSKKSGLDGGPDFNPLGGHQDHMEQKEEIACVETINYGKSVIEACCDIDTY
ncbi:hypothetical protein HJG60_011258 [Phyllostomus discolor]|uniref:Uncharacterized protein n=1 Tax=Phyllostomus discolor TaxID=89673 RepID=A0A833ZXB1_9CHIR|nr:hypothetical protein HJG60_011258 [Phyllostomus discolor]